MIDIAAIHLPPFHPFHLLHFFLLSSFLFYSLVSIFCPCRQFCTAIRTVREDAISGKTSGSIFFNPLYQCVNLTFALFPAHLYLAIANCIEFHIFLSQFEHESYFCIILSSISTLQMICLTCLDSFTWSSRNKNNGECNLFKKVWKIINVHVWDET